MIVEFHAIQNLGPSNVNRDDLGAPKNVIFGGTRRARVSSQSWKRAIRKMFEDEAFFDQAERGVRTKRLVWEIRNSLSNKHEAPGREHLDVVAAVVRSIVGIDSKSENLLKTEAPNETEIKTKYLVFAGHDAIERIAQLIADNWDDLNDSKRQAAAFKKLAPQFARCLDGKKAVDIGLFGRMLADLPEQNIDGATQFAHAISTHTVDIEFDYYTAVDDLKPGDTSGADMIGYVEYVAPTLYRYANLDTNQLFCNLGQDVELTRRTVRAFAQAFVESLPGGKRTSMDSSTLPAFVATVVRDKGRWSLVNAFVNPVERLTNHQDAVKKDYVRLSIEQAGVEWQELQRLYGTGVSLDGAYIVHANYADAASSFGERRASLHELIASVDGKLCFEPAPKVVEA